MEQYVIKGGNPLVGEVEIAGAKNAALAILAAAIMTDETILIENLPDVRDINVLLEAIAGIGAQVDRIDKSTVKINGSTIGDVSVDYEYIKKIRASYYLLGALLGKYNHAEVPLPGGCNIGSRPIDQHLKGFRALGADVDIMHGAIVAKADELHGSHIFLDVVSVGATINIMMAASLAPGRTILENAAREPHVVAAGLLSRDALNTRLRVYAVLRAWEAELRRAKAVSTQPAFDLLRTQFQSLAEERENTQNTASAALEAAFDFMEQAFAESQEMVVFVTELTLSPAAHAFITENGCERYFQYNKDLLLDHRKAALQQELAAEERRHGGI